MQAHSHDRRPDSQPYASHRAQLVLVSAAVAAALAAVAVFLFSGKQVTASRGIAEENLAVARAEALNMAIAAFMQSRGRNAAVTEWASQPSAGDRYKLLAPFLAFSPRELGDYMPDGYRVRLPGGLDGRLSKVRLENSAGGEILY